MHPLFALQCYAWGLALVLRLTIGDRKPKPVGPVTYKVER
jgi:hypothetical protein